MNITEIKTAVDAGKSVRWSNEGYVVRRDILGQYLIVFEPNGSVIGLTDRSGARLNGQEEEFFLADHDARNLPTEYWAKNGLRLSCDDVRSFRALHCLRCREKVESRLSVL